MPLRPGLEAIIEFYADRTGVFDRYFALKKAFEPLFGRKVNLATEGTLKNPHISKPSTTRARPFMRPRAPKVVDSFHHATMISAPHTEASASRSPPF